MLRLVAPFFVVVHDQYVALAGFGVARIEATTVQSVTVLNHMSLIGLLSVKAFVTGQQTRIG